MEIIWDTPERVHTRRTEFVSNPRMAGGVPVSHEKLRFSDVLDVVNPLQHLPLVGNLYRGITGDEIKPSARVFGGALYGGVAGAAASTVSVVVEAETGKDLTDTALSLAETKPASGGSRVADRPDARLSEVLGTSEQAPPSHPKRIIWPHYNE